MSQIDASFNSLREAITSLWDPEELGTVDVSIASHVLLLTLPSDIAAFSVVNSNPEVEFNEAYAAFKELYRENNRAWDERTLSFIVCRSSERTEDDLFYASLEHDPLFCRKYVIRAHQNVSSQRDELLRLPFLPLRGTEDSLQRPQSAQDFLQSAGLSASLSRKVVEAGHRSAERIVLDLREGKETLPETISQPRTARVASTRPRAHSRLVSLTVEGFRAYRDVQTFDLDGSVVVLYGPNGLGKTSFFDAIDYASTGRIGRLCRQQRRTQTEFSSLATHLDKTPGSGSVTLTVRAGGPNVDGSQWKLQRGTGNWSTAWLDGKETDRKTVMSSLTQANWLDSAPRQQALESLFRATHLFGQDEQELLAEFQNGSKIPEEFISEMLALQDYSQGLSKVTEVISELANQRGSIEMELVELRSESAAVSESLPQLDPNETEAAATPLEELIADFQKELRDTEFSEVFPEVASSSVFSEWREIVLARQGEIEKRIQVAQTLQSELPTYQRLLEESSTIQTQLEEIDGELVGFAAEEKGIRASLDASVKVLNENEARRKGQEKRRQDIRSAIEAETQRVDQLKQVTNLEAERDRQALARSEADLRLVALESTLSRTISSRAEAERARASAQLDLSRIEGLLRDLPQLEQDLKTLADLQIRIARAENDLQQAEQRAQQAAKELQECKMARAALRPQYERLLADQADLDKLLDSIQVHVHGDSCPLCGSKFESVEALLKRIQRARQSLSTENEVTVQYKTLTAKESQADDLLRVATTNVSACTSTVQELLELRRAAEDRIGSIRARLSKRADIPAGDLRQALTISQTELSGRLKALEQAVTTADTELRTAQNMQAEEVGKRRSLHERVATLQRTAQELRDRVAELDARISQVFPDKRSQDIDLSAEATAVDRSLEEILAAIERLHLSRRSEQSQLEAVVARTRSTSERRKQIVDKLTSCQTATAAIRQRLRMLDLPEGAGLESLNGVIRREERRADVVRRILDRADLIIRALRAREARLEFTKKQDQLNVIKEKINKFEQDLRQIQKALSSFNSIERLLQGERQSAIKKHLAAYGPMITKIQQRLRSVYGFEGFELEAHGGQAIVHVEWRNKRVQVAPTDFFSDSQKQILMLSIFLAGSLRQNWSGFSPVLLDDPVTHFDDLNAYAFVELIRGIIATAPKEWQFMISTCEDRLFNLMQKKFSRLPTGAIFYEFVGMSEKGPIVERR
ncbi:MAG: AAA family ATPase [Candidatus Sulfotelmatobacter sp.]